MRSIEEHRKLVSFRRECVSVSVLTLFSLFDRCSQCQWHFSRCVPVRMWVNERVCVRAYYYYLFIYIFLSRFGSNIIHLEHTIAWECVNRERNVWFSGSPYYVHSNLLLLLGLCFSSFYSFFFFFEKLIFVKMRSSGNGEAENKTRYVCDE